MPVDSGAFRLSLLYAVIFVEIGIAMPFMPVWLNALGLDAGLIGFLLALPIATRIVAAAPLLSLIDRGVGARTLLLVGSLVLAATYAAMPAGAAIGWPLLAALIVVNAVAGAPLVPSIDYLTLAAVRRDARLDYARIRLSGSIAFLSANLVGGALLGALPDAIAVPLLLTGLALLASLVAYASRGVAAIPSTPRPAGPVRLPRMLWLSIAAAAVVQSSHAAIYAFGSIYWMTHGISAGWVGLLWAIGVGSEICLFATVGQLPARWRTPFRLLGLGAGAALVRAIGMSFVGDQIGPMIPLQLLHGLTFGATQLGAMAAVSAFAPEGARGRAQGSLSAVNALAAASATLMTGAAYRVEAPLAFALMTPLALIGLCLVGAAWRSAEAQAFAARASETV
ncbi:MFS transporter [Methylobacterium planeticum]|uniref:MFS transporter n=1 Tax=Methylobacterium planeticum TaxID=2615211 RepID=A0A6N6MW32_9HYPH|nr:MFS transporter [Methylobacterium planeticum]KAB1074926.1 MFS transporter [Methylobacterium planeticum]